MSVPTSINPFAFQDALIKFLGIPKELDDSLIAIDLHSDCLSCPTATIKYEIRHPGDIEVVTKKFAITELPEEGP